VRNELGLDRGRILVAGDGRNDIGMFGWARALDGRAVAMGQAPVEVKEAASEVTADVQDGGLAQALDTLPAPAQVSAGE
jgi:hydroxymethylpyrimidine pyrophosphatase-like HAD family hydrolase